MNYAINVHIDQSITNIQNIISIRKSLIAPKSYREPQCKDRRKILEVIVIQKKPA